MARFNANIEICNRLKEFFGKEENKDLRFWQGLTALELLKHFEVDNDFVSSNFMAIEDNFNEESLVTLKKLINHE